MIFATSPGTLNLGPRDAGQPGAGPCKAHPPPPLPSASGEHGLGNVSLEVSVIVVTGESDVTRRVR